MLKTMLLAMMLATTGCARYAGWERVSIVDSVDKQPCEPKFKTEQCNRKDCDIWFKKRATIYKSNKVVKQAEVDASIGEYFYCAEGLPIYHDMKKAIWIIKNKFYPNATQLDYEKAVAECLYQSHSATIDTSKYHPTRLYVPTSSFYFNMAQLDAMRQDKLNESYHELDLRMQANALNDECMASKGIVIYRAESQDDLNKVKSICPKIETSPKYCFIPGGV